MTTGYCSVFFLYLLLQQSFAIHEPAAPDLVGDTCKQIAGDDPNVDSAFCVDSLRPAASAAGCDDLPSLAAVSSRLAAANATGAEAVAKVALEEGDQRLSQYEKSCLESCRELFSKAAYDLEEAAEMIAAGSFDDADVRMSSAVDAPAMCEEGFREGGVESPLEKEDSDLFQLAVIALAITARLLKILNTY
ncbi:hypothetical protein Cni_G06650 [Canna indica]|uniref:Pectinesterase inhibitor domain-containing protein n=1 Tax=Canna indica TaxID=4628 RepID=A0AAQ3Q6M2_9LILI|nr:hypothetical protein Cni_G06650 [Canna indica]